MEPVKGIKISKDMSVKDLVSEMNKSGVFGAGKIARASNILKKMIDDKDCKIFFGVAGAMVPGGMKNVIIDMLDDVDVFVTTGANLTHDLVEDLGESHYKGLKLSDAELDKKGIVRMYDSFMKTDVYKKLEKFFEDNFDYLNKAKNIREFLKVLGSKCNEGSILRTCYDKKIPIFCPSLADSGIGLMVWGRIAKGKKINIDAFDDMKEIIDIAWTSKKNGVIYVGGGVPKNFIQQSMQFSKKAVYGIQITTDRPEFGGSSGAGLGEGISWGKMESDAEYVNVICDATIALPLIYGAIK